MNTTMRVDRLIKRELVESKFDIDDGFAPTGVTRCDKCSGLVAPGPFEQLLVAAEALSLSLEDPTGCPEESYEEVNLMISRLCEIYESVKGGVA